MLAIVARIAAFFGLSSLRVWLTIGAIAGGVAFVTAVYVKGRTDASHKATVARLEQENAAWQRLYRNHQEQEAAQAAVVAEQEQKLQELRAYVDQLESADSPCLDEFDTRRLQDIIGR